MVNFELVIWRLCLQERRRRQQGWGRGGGSLTGPLWWITGLPSTGMLRTSNRLQSLWSSSLLISLSFSPSPSVFSPLASMNHSCLFFFFFFFPLRGSFRKKEKEEKKGIKIYTHKALPVLMFLLLCVAYYHRCWTNYLLDVCNVLPSLRAMLLMGQLFGFQC